MTNELTDDELREAIVRHEWDQFQRTNNEGGRAACQGNWPVFHQMRLAQFLTWERPLLTSYAADLDAADHVGRNLVTEKYGRMKLCDISMPIMPATPLAISIPPEKSA